MMVFTFLFLLFSSITLVSACLVVFLDQIVHSVLWLILTFFGASGLLLLMGVEYFAMLFLVVYVGAVVVLFLFAIMMISKKETNTLLVSPLKFPIIAAVLSLLFLIGFIFFTVGQTYIFEGLPAYFKYCNYPSYTVGKQHIELIAEVLYTQYYLLFIVASLVLFAAMIGAIVLTIEYEKKENLKSQQINQQLARDFKNSIFSIKKN